MKISWKQRLKHWFDNRMAGGTASMIAMLGTATCVIIILLAVILYLFDGDSFFSVLWDSFATTVNAWMPYSEDGSPMYIALMAVGALMGILFTSLLIGIFTTAVEDKVNDLRSGSPLVQAENHIVIIGMHTGIYRLLEELIATAEGKKMTLVVSDAGDKQETEEMIHENVDIPKNITLLCRHGDPCDPVQLACCNIPAAGMVILNLGDDAATMRSVLAVNTLLKDTKKAPVIISVIEDENYRKAIHEAGAGHQVLTVHASEMISRLIAHTCTQPGLSAVFEEIFCYRGMDFYFQKIDALNGMSFKEICGCMTNAVPVGYAQGKNVNLVPKETDIYQNTMQLIYLAETADSCQLDMKQESVPDISVDLHRTKAECGRVLIFGENDRLDKVCRELETVHCQVQIIKDYMSVAYRELETICGQTDHIIVLNPEEENDDACIRMLLLLKALRRRKKKNFNVTVEMKDEKNKLLMNTEDDLDYVIASDLSNMVIAQAADMPQRLTVFRELLSDEGKELYMLPAVSVDNRTSLTCGQLRQCFVHNGILPLGVRRHNGEIHFWSDVQMTEMIQNDDEVIVLADEC